MPDRYLLESGSPDGYLLEDGSGVLLLDALPAGTSTKWRLANITSTDGAYVGLAEIEMRATSGGADQCSGGTATASDYLLSDATYAPGKAFDDDILGTFWHSGGTYPAWIQYEFASGVAVTEISATRRFSSNGNTIAPSAFDVQYWDGSAWQTSWSVSGQGSWTASDSETRTFTQPASGSYTLTAAAGAFALSGTAATLKRGLKLSAAPGAYSLTGTAATLKKGFKLPAAAASFSLAGTAATFPVTRKLAAAAGAFALSGTAASLKRGLKISAASGSFALTGTAATLTKSSVNNYTLTAASGSFALSGTATTLKRGLKLSAATGSYSLTGTAANLKRGLRLTANSGSYALTGTAVNFAQSGSRTMTALPAAFVITGSASTRRLNSAGGGGSIAFFLS